jgi:hypothetical protein
MQNETITVTNTESGQPMQVVVLNKRAHLITVVIGEGIHNVQCDLVPTRNGQAYAGTIMGREIVYSRSREQVQADLDAVNPDLKKSRKF